MPIRPIGDRILVQPLTAATQTAGGLHIPTSAQEKQTRGVVRATGPGRPDKNGNPISTGVKTGDEVLYTKYAGTEIQYDGEDFVILTPNDIIGVLEPESPEESAL
jgi:chaperonin GroES